MLDHCLAPVETKDEPPVDAGLLLPPLVADVVLECNCRAAVPPC